MNISKTGIITAVLIFQLGLGASVEARHDDYRSRIDRDRLDDDPVEEFAPPVLFGINMANVQPDYGDPRGGGTREHEGQDMIGPRGTPIVSPTEAIVIRTGTGDSAGKYVYTANPGGETFRYMHLDEIAELETGDVLDVGDLIGTVGDTGNAPDGVYHLHFEVRDEDNRATDPYPRLQDTFTLKERIAFFNAAIDDDLFTTRYLETVVNDHKAVFLAALQNELELDRKITAILEDTPEAQALSVREQLRSAVAVIPSILQMNLALGDEGAAVSLLQLYIIYSSDGPARDALAQASATGYFGPITQRALVELEAARGLEADGAYTAADGRRLAED